MDPISNSNNSSISFVTVESLDLPMNKLSGSIPSEVGLMMNLGKFTAYLIVSQVMCLSHHGQTFL